MPVAPPCPCPTPPERVLLVAERDNPSLAYFLLPALAGLGWAVTRRGFADRPAAAELDGALAVLVRGVPPGWAGALTAGRDRLAGLVFFMDDDLFDPLTWAGTPWRYRLKLWRLAAARRGWLRRQGAALWVSTPYLRDKYTAWNPHLLLPTPLADTADGPDPGTRLFFYHGTASHGPDLRWLRPVVAAALAADARLRFETLGGRAVARAYRGLDRAAVVHPLSWPAYRNFAGAGNRAVGLAPQLDNAFNRARSYTKFCDITRSGAVGIYAAGSACATVVTPGVDGLVLPMEPVAWARAIVALARDDARRAAMLARARVTADRLAAAARDGLAELRPGRGARP